jgi:predicted MPP superfamily phosphohydrolase
LTPLAQFILIASLYHAALLMVAALLLRRWRVRLRKPPPLGRWTLEVAADAVVFGTALLVLAVLAGTQAPVSPAFGAVRLAAQGLFGEGVLVSVAVAVLHFRARLRGRGGLLAAAGLLPLGVYWEAYHHGPYDLQVRQHAVDLSQGRAESRTLRLVHLSDLQTDRIGAHEHRALGAAADLRPDLIVFTGDYLQDRLTPSYDRAAADLRAVLGRRGLPLGLIAVEGDVDQRSDRDWRELFADVQPTCLRDGSTLLTLPGGRTLAATGLSLLTSRGNEPERVRAVVAAAPAADLRLVVGHSPDFVRALPGGRHVDLALAGHTHGGQVVLPFVGPPITLSRLPNRYAGGLNDYRGTPLHVSRGIGRERGVAPQIRLLCPPEVCLLEIRY